jgi:hypothetical protein
VLATGQPDRVRGHLPAAEAQLDRFLLRGLVRLPVAEEEWEVLRRRMGRPPGGGRGSAVVDARACSPCRPRWRTSLVEDSVGATSWRSPRPPGAHRTCWSARRRAGRWRCCCSPGRWAALSGRDVRGPEDVKAVAVPALAHRITLRPRCGCAGSSRPRRGRTCWNAPRAGERRAAQALMSSDRQPDRPGWPTKALGRAMLLTGVVCCRRAVRPVRPGGAGGAGRARRGASRWRAGRRGAGGRAVDRDRWSSRGSTVEVQRRRRKSGRDRVRPDAGAIAHADLGPDLGRRPPVRRREPAGARRRRRADRRGAALGAGTRWGR